VTLYTCGPTVWNYAHIGNFRTFVFEDMLRRYLEYLGYDVVHVMNLTDVDDRTINAAGAAHRPLAEHTAPFTRAFFEDRDYLRIKPATRYPAATEFIGAMVALVERLLEKDVAYRGDDGSVYFAIDRFPTYGRLSRIEQRQIKVGARVSSDEYAKEDARDFVLWKAAKPEDEAAGAAWDAPFGRGRPGWHLECSAMSQHYLGETLDIHGGGEDLIFPHHEDEIAQTESAFHDVRGGRENDGEFLQVDGTKMSKRYGNFLTARDLRENGVAAAAVRYLFGQTHYRKQLEWSDEALAAAAAGAQRLRECRDRLEKLASGESSRLAALADKLEADFRSAMDHDLDVPAALAAVQTFVREANAAMDKDRGASPVATARALEAFDRVTEVLQVVPPAVPAAADDESWARDLAEQRARYKKERNWARADELRKLLLDKGFEVRDTREGGFELRRVTAGPTDT
jgi:cysteinyl-tRNA synthetase